MNRNSHNLRGSSVNPTPRWRSVFIVLLLVFVIGSAGPASTAQAAPAGATYRFTMRADRSKSTNALCVGEQVNVYVSVGRTTMIFGITVQSGAVTAEVTPMVANSDIVTISPASNSTGWDIDNAGTAKFVLTAQKPGETAVAFTGRVAHQWLGTRIADRIDIAEDGFAVRVINCKYKVKVISDWFISQGTGGSIALVAVINGATLTADSEGNYTGSTTALWIPNIVLPPECTHTDTIPPSPAKLTGSLNEHGDLTVKIIFDAATLTEVGACLTEDINTTNAMTPDPLILTVPGAGGTWSGTQLLQSPSGAIAGQVTVIVIPVEE